MKFRHLLLLSVLLMASLTAVFIVRATCNPSDVGTVGNDTIICDLANQPALSVEGFDGDDVIVINDGIGTPAEVNGGYAGAASESGNDTIINNGNMFFSLTGDSATGDGSGNDTIINNGVTGNIVGDTITGDGSGSDTLINNGTINGEIIGDSNIGNGSGNDTITNNGTVNFNIRGDTSTGTSSTGNDTITNNGTVNGGIYGDDTAGTGTGNDTITNSGTVNGNILAGGGTDTVIVRANTAQVGGTIDGGGGYDVLTFNLTSTDPAVLYDAAAQIAAANPNGGTITLAGHTYTWANFEELTQLIFSMARVNGLMDPLTVFCALSGGVDVYLVSGSTGVFSLNVSEQVISNALAQAANNRVQIGASATASVYALPTGELEVTGTNGFSFSFTYQTYCGALPAPNGDTAPVVEGEEELPSFSIINQPYSG